MGFTVGGTKKGRMPVTTEKRPRGKVVTLIGNVRGDKDELIKLLKHSLGCGGHAVGHQHVEIQGDHQSAIQALLLKHGGTDTMKGVEGLKEEKANEKGGQKEKEDYIDHRDLLLEKWKKAQSNVKSSNHRAEESRRVKMAQATLTKRKSTREFHAFAQMMKQWRYWDQDYGRLHEMHHRHSRELDEAKNLSVGASFLDADLDDNDRLQSGPRSSVLELMFRNLSAIESGADATTRSYSGQDSSTYSQLQKLGMVAEPSPFRQTREERVTEHRRNAAAKAKALAIAKRNGSSVGVSVAPVPKNWDPALAALEFGGYEPFEKRTDEGRVIKPSSSGGTGGSTSGSLGWAARTARTRTVPHSRGTRKAPGRGSFAKPGGHGKAGASRPTIGFTGNRKRSAAHYDHPVGFSDDGFNSEDKEEEGVARWDVQPSFQANQRGGFSFGPIEGAEVTPDWVTHGTSNDAGDDSEMDAEELDLREALRLSVLESEAEAEGRWRVGLHMECDDVWGDLTEEQALKLAMELSEQDEMRRKREEFEYEAYGEYGEDQFSGDELPSEGDLPGDSDLHDHGPDQEHDAEISDEDAALAEALRLSVLESERESEQRRGVSGVMPSTMDEDTALEEALRLSALEAMGGRAGPSTGIIDGSGSREPRDGYSKGNTHVRQGQANSHNHVAGPSRVSPPAAAIAWAEAQLIAFTGETDKIYLFTEYVMTMSNSEITEFLGESFGDFESAKAFADALDAMR